MNFSACGREPCLLGRWATVPSVAPSRAPSATAGRGLPTLLALLTLGIGLGLLALAVDPGVVPDAVTISEDWVRWPIGVVGALHAALGVRALVRLYGGRWGEQGTRPATAAERRRLVVLSVFDDLTGTALVVLGLLGGAGDVIRLESWAVPVAIVSGALLSLLGVGLLVLGLRSPPGELPPGVTGTSWRRPG